MITITLSSVADQRLRQEATIRGLTPEVYARQLLEELLAAPSADSTRGRSFEEAMEYSITKSHRALKALAEE